MANYKTPGVYIEEIPTLGSSVASVPTAIPGFTGYTEKAVLPDGTSATLKPVRITSLLEYQQYFGGPFKEQFTVTLTGTAPTPTTIAIASTSPATGLSKYILFYQLQMFFGNGGGACYVVSVGGYSSPSVINGDSLKNGIDALEQIDEVTLLATPEAVSITTGTATLLTLNDLMAAQCAKLQDRFTIVDVLSSSAGPNTNAASFRSTQIGSNNLKYVAAYYPSLKTPLINYYLDKEVTIVDSRSGAIYNTSPNNKLNSIYKGVCAFRLMTVTTALVAGDSIAISTPDGVITLAADTDFPKGSTALEGMLNLISAINSNLTLSKYVEAAAVSVVTTFTFHIIAKNSGVITYTITGSTRITSTGALAGGVNNSADISLYNQIKAELDKNTLTLYPSATMAGIYAIVDADRGVWKAPANVGVTMVNEPSLLLSSEEQEGLNVDSASGKSINVIRQFTGRGNIVWGARTLAGNDNEWRYVNVRRLFIFVEESIKKATEFVIFEPNTAATWQRVKSMSEAFLTGLWRDGALAGATTKDAFFVRVGLGVTMTADDILNGKMIVEIGLAASRPAEFIILRFSHKIQES